VANITPEGYLSELKNIKQKLSDFLDMVDKGNLSYFKDISLKFCRVDKRSASTSLFMKKEAA
jgi:hypothetical protein